MTDTITLPRKVVEKTLHCLCTPEQADLRLVLRDLTKALEQQAVVSHESETNPVVSQKAGDLIDKPAQQADAKPKMVTPYITQEQFDRVFPMEQQAVQTTTLADVQDRIIDRLQQAEQPTCTNAEWLANCPQSVRDIANKIKQEMK